MTQSCPTSDPPTAQRNIVLENSPISKTDFSAERQLRGATRKPGVRVSIAHGSPKACGWWRKAGCLPQRIEHIKEDKHGKCHCCIACGDSPIKGALAIKDEKSSRNNNARSNHHIDKHCPGQNWSLVKEQDIYVRIEPAKYDTR